MLCVLGMLTSHTSTLCMEGATRSKHLTQSHFHMNNKQDSSSRSSAQMPNFPYQRFHLIFLPRLSLRFPGFLQIWRDEKRLGTGSGFLTHFLSAQIPCMCSAACASLRGLPTRTSPRQNASTPSSSLDPLPLLFRQALLTAHDPAYVDPVACFPTSLGYPAFLLCVFM